MQICHFISVSSRPLPRHNFCYSHAIPPALLNLCTKTYVYTLQQEVQRRPKQVTHIVADRAAECASQAQGEGALCSQVRALEHRSICPTLAPPHTHFGPVRQRLQKVHHIEQHGSGQLRTKAASPDAVSEKVMYWTPFTCQQRSQAGRQQVQRRFTLALQCSVFGGHHSTGGLQHGIDNVASGRSVFLEGLLQHFSSELANLRLLSFVASQAHRAQMSTQPSCLPARCQPHHQSRCTPVIGIAAKLRVPSLQGGPNQSCWILLQPSA
mmetsp:Transcript_58596/g.110489  ORF Transcript_58596/g.110489 Transcript_58596/m.110489 type:complete len:267 (+) Transcript_58596:1329-2129(+)